MQKTLEPKEMEIGGSEYFATRAGQNATASEFPCHTDVYMSIWACRAGPARARLGTSTVPRHGTARPRAVPGQHAVPAFLPRHGTVKLRRAVPCLGHGQPGSAVPCPCPGHTRAQSTPNNAI